MSISNAGIGYSQTAALRPQIKVAHHKQQAATQLWASNEAGPARTGAENITRRPANSSQSVLSHETNAALLHLQEVGGRTSPAQTLVVTTNKGDIALDIDDYFSDDPSIKGDLLDTPLLLPSANNINALSQHASARFKQMLSNYNIPSAPEQITYDNKGQMQLPDDYPYAEELTQALEDNPGLERELQTVNALTSHYVEMQKSLRFQQEYANARSHAEIEAVIAKYSHLFQNNRDYSQIALTFSEDGNLGLTADGKPVQLA